ncbi:MAG: hypothetical protein ONB46_10195 [candidate division KSB1 bacterium]|nr:hypothetical protein [candidate division KSB1 bacterium]MDZ7366174.1 hypothetical protein [candidate division KSB1 bacterium]
MRVTAKTDSALAGKPAFSTDRIVTPSESQGRCALPPASNPDFGPVEVDPAVVEFERR